MANASADATGAGRGGQADPSLCTVCAWMIRHGATNEETGDQPAVLTPLASLRQLLAEALRVHGMGGLVAASASKAMARARWRGPNHPGKISAVCQPGARKSPDPKGANRNCLSEPAAVPRDRAPRSVSRRQQPERN